MVDYVGFQSVVLPGQAEGFYNDSFGKAGIPDGAVYLDAMHSVDLRKDIGKEIGKMVIKEPVTSTTGGTYTEYTLFPVFPDATVVDRTVRDTPLLRLLRRIAVRGPVHVYNTLTSKDLAKFIAEDSPITENNHTRSNGYAAMKICVASGRITDFSQVASTIYNPMQQEIAVASDALNQKLENEIINGDTSSDSLGFNGLLASITTNATNNAGAAITLPQLRDDMNLAYYTGSSGVGTGHIDFVATDGYTLNTIKGLLQDYLLIPVESLKIPANLDFGIPEAFYFDGALFLKDRFMPTTAASRQIVYIDSRYAYLAVLRDTTYEELAKVDLTRRFALSWMGSLVVSFEAACARRYGLA